MPGPHIPDISVVVPVYNEVDNIRPFYDRLLSVIKQESNDNYEMIFVDDGSRDQTARIVAEIRADNTKVKLVSLSRNFGKEIALAAGIAAAQGRTVLTIDGDGQMPVEKIPEFMRAWRDGAQVIIGVRTENRGEGWIKKYGSRLFYALFNRLSGASMVAGSSDFRLIDREVADAFNQMYEPNRITRGLIDWLGYRRAFVKYAANPRTAGVASYKIRSLFKLAANSFVSLSPMPLYAFGYLGVFITLASLILGLSILVEQIVLNDPLHWHFTGTAMLSVLVLFLVGLILVSQGALALYISHIHTQTKRRPLYVINKRVSLGFDERKG